MAKRKNGIKKFDEGRYYNEALTLANSSPTDSADVATTLRKRLHNAMMEAEELTQKGMELGAGLLAAGVVGGLDGRWEAEAENMMAEWQAGGAVAAGKSPEEDPFEIGALDDPMQLMGSYGDKALWMTGALAAVAVTGVAGEYSNLVAAGAIGSASYYVGSFAKAKAKEARIKSLETEGEEED